MRNVEEVINIYEPKRKRFADDNYWVDYVACLIVDNNLNRKQEARFVNQVYDNYSHGTDLNRDQFRNKVNQYISEMIY